LAFEDILLLNSKYGQQKLYHQTIEKRYQEQVNQMDANFISMWCQEDQKFHFIVERLYGKSVNIRYKENKPKFEEG
jgi:hypothetical protein